MVPKTQQKETQKKKLNKFQRLAIMGTYEAMTITSTAILEVLLSLPLLHLTIKKEAWKPTH